MPRRNLIKSSHYPYHISSKANEGQWFKLVMPDMWQIAKESLRHAYLRHPADIISFVLMSNHYHLLIKTPDANIDKFMYEFNKSFSLSLKKKATATEKMLDGRYNWCLIKSSKYLKNCYRYIYQNPLRANIVHRSEDYPYSTLYYKARGKDFGIPLVDLLGFSDEFKCMWLNREVDEQEVMAIKKAFYRSVLTELKDAKTRKLI